MLDVDQEFDQGFDQQSPAEGAAEPRIPAEGPNAPAGGSGAAPPSRAEKPGFPGPAPAAQPNRGQVNATPGAAPDDAAPHEGKNSRSLAESAYQRIADEILESTREVCQRLISDGEKALERAKFLETENEQKRQELQKEMDSIGSLKAEAEGFRRQSLAGVTEAQKQAQDILDRARQEAQTHLSDSKGQSAAEAEKTVAEAKAMKSAAQEELEAQKLYTEAARLKAESNEALSQLRQQMGSLLSSSGRRASQSAPAPVQAQAAGGRPATPSAPAPAATGPLLDTDLDESGVKAEATSTGPDVRQSPAPAGPNKAPVSKPTAKPVEEDTTLSRKKAGRWFGL